MYATLPLLPLQLSRPGFPRVPLPAEVPRSWVDGICASEGMAVASFPFAATAGPPPLTEATPKLGCAYLSDGADRFSLVVSISAQAQGPPGSVHGGCILTLIDSAMAAANLSRGVPAVTAEIGIHYLAFTPVDGHYRIDVSATQPIPGHERRFRLEAELKGLETGVTHARGTSEWVRMPRAAAL